MSKTFITWKDDKVNNIQQGKTPVGEGPWTEVPNNWNGRHGDKREWFDETMHRIPDQELVRRGIRINNKGRVYNINDMSSRIIDAYDKPLKENETKEAPLENEAYQKFDQQTKKWVVDIEKKELAEEQAAISQIQAQIEENERKMLPLIIAQNRGRATVDDLAKLNELDDLIEINLKPELGRKKSSLDAKLAVRSEELRSA